MFLFQQEIAQAGNVLVPGPQGGRQNLKCLIQAGNVLIPEHGREPIRKAHRRAVARRHDAKLRNEFRGPKVPGQAASKYLRAWVVSALGQFDVVKCIGKVCLDASNSTLLWVSQRYYPRR